MERRRITTRRSSRLLTAPSSRLFVNALYAILLLLLLLLPCSTRALVLYSGHDSYTSPTELYLCYDALVEADTNADAQVNRDEYTQFALLMVPSDMPITNDMTVISEYEDLPVSLRAAFLSAACLCGNDSNNYSTTSSTLALTTAATTTTTSACCVGDKAAIRVPPQPPFTSASTSQDERYLYAVCSIVMSAIQVAYLEHATNTSNDTISDAPATIVPTLAPSTSTTINNTNDDAFPPLETQVTYEIAMPASINADTSQREVAMTDLQTAVDQLVQAVVVSVSVTSSNNNARRRRRRRLGESTQQQKTQDNLGRRMQQQNDQQAISVQLPTSFGSVSDKDCSLYSSWKEPDYVCQDVTSLINLLGVNPSDSVAVQAEFEQAMLKAIDGGRLQALLEMTNPNTPIRIVVEENPGEDNISTGAPASTAPPQATQKKGISTAGIIAASIGAVLLVIPALYLLARHKQRDKKLSNSIDKDLYAVAPSELENPHPDYDEDDNIGHMGYDDDDEQPTTTMTSSSERVMTNTSSDTTASPLPMHRRSFKERSSSSSSSSTASSGDQSPANDAEFVTTDRQSSYDANSTVQSAAAIGLVAATGASLGVSTSDSKESERFSPSSSSDVLPHVTLSTSTIDVLTFPTTSDDDIHLSTSSETVEETRHRLDQALQAHDWAAVGDAAAILAVASEQEDPTSSDKNLGSQKRYAIRSVNTNAIVDSNKVKQLDQLVRHQDWDGLVDLAARFEAEEFERRSSRGSDADSMSGSRTSGSVTGSDADSQLGLSASQSDNGSRDGTSVSGSVVSTGASGSHDQAHVSAETRAQVIALVRRVVPEEADNVDEMLQQFHGREDELIETLRSMQERAVAQRAREAKQKAAKAEARQRIKSQRTGDNSVVVFRPSHDLPDVMSALTSSPTARVDENNVTLDDILGEHRAQSEERSHDTSELESRTTSESVDTHAKALERAIESGNWQAVAEVAALLSGASTTGEGLSSPATRSGSRASLDMDLVSETSQERSFDHTVDPSRLRELDKMIVAGDWNGVIEASQRYCQEDGEPIEMGRSKEEEEALQQAALWETIAEKSKIGAADDAGAVDAAEWAIRRSLSQLKERELLESGSREERISDNEV